MSSFATALLDRRYRVTHLLSERMAERHYAGWHVELALPVRIVAMRCHAEESGAIAERTTSFWSLATQATRIRHTALPQVRDCFRHGDDYFVVTSEMTGDVLAERLERGGRLSLRASLSVGLQLCDALDHLRRVSTSLAPLTTIAPCDILLRPSGHVALAHLGPQRWLGLPEKGYDRHYLPFLAPEVLDGQAVDERADIYSLGAVLYNALTGTPPMPPGPTRMCLNEIEPLVPAALSDVIDRAMSQDPGSRFTSAADFGEALGIAVCSALPGLVASRAQSRTLAPTPGLTIPHERDDVSAPDNISPHPQSVSLHAQMRHWPQQWAHELSRVAESRPLRRARERASSTKPPLVRHGS